MLNRVVLVGRLTKDPEMKVSQSNIAVTNFTLAVNRPFTDKSTGERGADFLPVVVFRKQAETVGQSLRKGSLVGVDGRIQTRNYENKDGQRVYVTEIIADSVQFLEPKNAGQGGQPQQQNNNSYQNSYGQNQPPQQQTQYNNQAPQQQQYNQGGQQYGQGGQQPPQQQQYNQGGYNNQPPQQQYNQGNQQQGQAGNGPVINDDDLPF